MPENEGAPEFDNREYFKEAVCIDAMRIYDSCSEKDCSFYKQVQQLTFGHFPDSPGGSKSSHCLFFPPTLRPVGAKLAEAFSAEDHHDHWGRFEKGLLFLAA